MVLSWFVRRAGNAVTEHELQRDPMTVLCPVSLCVLEQMCCLTLGCVTLL